MKKNNLIVGIVVLVVILGLGGVFAWKNLAGMFSKNTTTDTTKKKTVVEQANVIPVAERPYLQLSPTADGRKLTVLVKELKKPADTMDYLLEYETGSLLQGVQGEISLGKIPAQTEQLLGSCSAGGKCTYHENVSGGKIETTYFGAENYKLRQEWRFITNTAKEKTFGSRDGKFQVTSGDLAKQKYMVILNSPGYPKTPSGTVVSDPYAFAASQTLSGTADVSIRVSEASDGLTIQGWDGSTWQTFESTISDSIVTAAKVPLMELYLVTKK